MFQVFIEASVTFHSTSVFLITFDSMFKGLREHLVSRRARPFFVDIIKQNRKLCMLVL